MQAKMPLTEWITQSGTTKVDALKILSSIADKITTGTYTHLNPESIFVTGEYAVEIKRNRKDDNAFFLAPELIFGGANPSEKSALFSFGMLYYYLLHHSIWYVDRKIYLHNGIQSRNGDPCDNRNEASCDSTNGDPCDNRNETSCDSTNGEPCDNTNGGPSDSTSEDWTIVPSNDIHRNLNLLISPDPQERIDGFDAFDFQRQTEIPGISAIYLRSEKNSHKLDFLFYLGEGNKHVELSMNMDEISGISFWRWDREWNGQRNKKCMYPFKYFAVRSYKGMAVLDISYDDSTRIITLETWDEGKKRRLRKKPWEISVDLPPMAQKKKG